MNEVPKHIIETIDSLKLPEIGTAEFEEMLNYAHQQDTQRGSGGSVAQIKRTYLEGLNRDEAMRVEQQIHTILTVIVR